uniref:Carm_PH domain-containing protein n=1 Tax=Panagrellus redivivus TaxID=6233 RepID=A0A7E4ZZG2_PANRE
MSHSHRHDTDDGGAKDKDETAETVVEGEEVHTDDDEFDAQRLRTMKHDRNPCQNGLDGHFKASSVLKSPQWVSSIRRLLKPDRHVNIGYQSRHFIHQRCSTFAGPVLGPVTMSLSRDNIAEARAYIKENCALLFGKKYWECRTIIHIQYAPKSDKFESRFLAISKFRVFILHGKAPNLKVDKKFNLLALRSIQIVTPNKELSLSWEDRSGRGIVKGLIRCDEKPTIDIAREMLMALKHYFPDIGANLSNIMTIVPSSLVSEFASFPESTPKLLCNNFRRSYVAICDYYDQRYKDEVVWDFEHIYFTHDLHEIRLEDFTHLPIKDQITILATAQFSSYFTGISVDGTKLVYEHIEVLFNIIRRSHALKSLRLVNCGLPKDFITNFASALSTNHTVPLDTIDFSHNNLDDRKGFLQLATILPKLTSLKTIVLSSCNLSEKCVAALSSGLISGVTLQADASKKVEPRALVLSGNPIKDDVSELVNFVSLCTSLRVLDLSNTGILVDRLWTNLKLGGLQLEVLRLSGCSTGKKSKDHAGVVRELFACMVNLKEIDFSGTSLGPDVLQAFIAGLANNAQVKDVVINLNGVCDRSCVTVLEGLADCSVGSLSLRDSSFEHELVAIIVTLRKMTTLNTLDLGGSNFYSLKNHRKHASAFGRALQELVQLMNDGNLQELNLSDCRIGESMHIILNALGVAKLSLLDISNNEMTNTGARLLSKALQLNHCLQKLYIDRNQITAEGFVELAHALKLNLTIQSLPTPLLDVADALGKPDRARVLTAINEIERYLERNRVAATHARNEELRQKVIHKLNNRSDLYDINGSDYKRVIFFEVLKVVSDLGMTPLAPVDAPIDLAVVDSVVARLEELGDANDHRIWTLVREALADKGVEIAENVEAPSNVNEYLKKSVRQHIENHLTEMAWATVFAKTDRLLMSGSALKLRGSLSNGAIDHSVHGGFTRTSHRPDSIIAESSSSPSRTASIDELRGYGDTSGECTPKTTLQHVVKSRPTPARRNRAKSKDPSTILNATTSACTTPDMHHSTTSHMSSSSADSDSPRPTPRTAILPPGSPKLHAISVAPDETPPPVPKRTLPVIPPKLPPKPDSPAKSPTHKNFGAFGSTLAAQTDRV